MKFSIKAIVKAAIEDFKANYAEYVREGYADVWEAIEECLWFALPYEEIVRGTDEVDKETGRLMRAGRELIMREHRKELGI